jgi:hypothetical protein
MKSSAISELIGLVEQAETDAASYWTRKNLNYNQRFCLWAGQDETGRKYSANLGKQAFPWDGASDAKIRLSDMIVNERVRLMKNSFGRARLAVMPTETTDIMAGRKVETVIQWILNSHCAAMTKREIELAANIRETYGLAVMGVFWRRSTRNEKITFTLESLQMQYMETGDPQLALIIEAILDPTQEEAVAREMDALLPGQGTTSNVRKLRETGAFEYDSPYIFENLPDWQAYEPWEDIIFPPSTYDLQRAPFIACRELLREDELREREITEDYDPRWIEEAVKHTGVNRRNARNMYRVTDSLLLSDERDMIQKKWNEQIGAMEVWCTHIQPSVVDRVAKSEAMGYEHGHYPFVELPLERTSRPLIESRGVPELVATQQSEIKVQRDYRSDRASLTILPPLKVPANRGKMDIVLGPAKQLPERRPGEFQWMAPPANDMGTIEIEAATRRDVDEYFGIPRADMAPQRALLAQQDLVDTWLADMALILGQTFQLCQQYLDDIQFVRVAGGLPTPFRASRQDIQGKYDLRLDFDARTLDSEALKIKMQGLTQLIPLDTEGVIDRAGLVKFLFGSIDPNLAGLLVRDADAASQQEMDDEQVQFTKIAAGAEPPLKSEGQNFQLRLQTLQNIIQSNPAIQQRLQQDQIFAAMLTARMESFSFQLQQQQNAQIGRVGAQPGLQKVAEQMQQQSPQP